MEINIRMNTREGITAINSGKLLQLLEAVDATEIPVETKHTSTPKPTADQQQPDPQPEKSTETSTTRTRKKAVDKSVDEKKAEPALTEDPAPQVEDSSDISDASIQAHAEDTEEKKITLKEVQDKLTGIAKAGKQTAVKTLIASYGVTKLSDISEDKYPEVMEKAEAL